MTKKQAEQYVADHEDSDLLDDGDLEDAFEAIFERKPDDQDKREGLWSHLCAAVN